MSSTTDSTVFESEEFTMMLMEIFSRYDDDKDMCLSVSELREFLSATNSYNMENINEIMDLFGTDNSLSLEGFLDMYLCQSLQSPVETWKDIEIHGYEIRNGLICKKILNSFSSSKSSGQTSINLQQFTPSVSTNTVEHQNNQ